MHVGVYGDVQRVKILYNKKDSALIQMAEPHQAHLGNYFLRISLTWLVIEKFRIAINAKQDAWKGKKF